MGRETFNGRKSTVNRSQEIKILQSSVGGSQWTDLKIFVQTKRLSAYG